MIHKPTFNDTLITNINILVKMQNKISVFLMLNKTCRFEDLLQRDVGVQPVFFFRSTYKNCP